jgi:hypothetical protein
MTASYNRIVRKVFLALVMLSLAACNRGLDNNKDAVRQGVVDYLSAKNFNVKGMTVDITSVKFDGQHADAMVSMAPKGGPSGTGMMLSYRLDQKDGKWVVTGPAGGHPGSEMPADGANPHGGSMPPGDNPHGGSMAPAGGGGGVPSPDDLPPVKKK